MFNTRRSTLFVVLAYALGAVEALLLSRLVLRLFAARPDHPVVAALYLITAPVQALAFLDASQPRFGATLELSTLALFLLILCVGLIIGLARRARARGKR
ncbi:MAG: YggT family protein [Kouleothrix sp.]|nr:YggT family protein [Kouleothrix sp.]